MTEIDGMSFWMEQLANRAEGTKKKYREHLLRFAGWMGKSPNELIEMKMASKNHKGDPRENRALEVKVKAYLNHLEVKVGVSVSYRQLAYAAIRSFFRNNIASLEMCSQDRPKGDAGGSNIPEKEDIIQMVNGAKSRQYRAIILFLKDSGLRSSDIVRLKWRDSIDYGGGFWGWKILTRKRGVKAIPFVGPETTDALKQLDRKDEKIFPMTAKTVQNTLSEIIKEVGIDNISGHGLRKYFNTELQAARVPREWRYQMMGKKTGAYDEKRARILFEDYKKAYDNLRIFGVDKGLSKRVGEVEADNESLRVRVDKLIEENKTLKSRINGISESRRESDNVMDKLFEDPEFKTLLRKKLKELI